MTILNKIGDAFMTNKEKRNLVKTALEVGGLIVATQSETGLIIMEEIEDDEEIEEESD